MTDAGQNCILIYTGTNGILTESYVEEVLSHFDHEDIVLVQNETNLVGSIMTKAKEKGMRIAFNAAPMDENVLTYPIEQVDWLFVNETEGAAISGETDYHAIAATLRERYPNTAVILTLGEEGSIYAGKEGMFSVPAQTVKAVDTTAAGDSFVASFSTLWCAGLPARQALAFASHAAAITVSRPGAIPSLPTLAEVTALLRERGYEDMDYDLLAQLEEESK